MEDRFLEAIDFEENEDGEEDNIPSFEGFRMRRRRLQRKNKAAVNKFLGEGRRVNSSVIFPSYYGELLAWALQRYMEKEEWEVARTLGYYVQVPVYIDVKTDYDRCENLLTDGQLMVVKDDIHLMVTVDIHVRWKNSVQVEGPISRKKQLS